MADTVPAVPAVKFKKRGKSAATRRVAVLPTKDSNSDSDSDGEGDDGRVMKKRKTNANALKTSSAADQKSVVDGATKYEASRSAVILNDKKEEITPVISGPVKSSNVRIISMMDFKPDVCVDYKKTGFCGFGDSCCFAHIREESAGSYTFDTWKLPDKASGGTVVASANRNLGDKSDASNDLRQLDNIPFKCIICKEDYKNPVVTKCGHHFCEACALKRYRKDPTCANCGAKTYGVFNGARNLARLLEKKKKLDEEKKAEEEEKKPPE